MSLRLNVDRRAIAAFCRRHHVRRLAVFGSALRDDFRPDSDIDLLAEFEVAIGPRVHSPAYLNSARNGISPMNGPATGSGKISTIQPKME